LGVFLAKSVLKVNVTFFFRSKEFKILCFVMVVDWKHQKRRRKFFHPLALPEVWRGPEVLQLARGVWGHSIIWEVGGWHGRQEMSRTRKIPGVHSPISIFAIICEGISRSTC
jgi:hypothetical protein